MRSIAQIKKEMTDKFINDPDIQEAYFKPAPPAGTRLVFENEFSTHSIESIFFYVVAFCAWVLEGLFDQLKADVNDTISRLKPHSLRWYAEKAKKYQHGFELPLDSDVYSNTDTTSTAVEASKVVKHCSVSEEENIFKRPYLRMKLAGTDGENLLKVSSDELTGVKEYFSRIKDAGVKLEIISEEADLVKMDWIIYYDPLVFNKQGNRLDGSNNESVQDVIKQYLQNLPFDGMLVPQHLIDAVQAVEGVIICELTSCMKKSQMYAEVEFTDIGVTYTPDAGYMRFNNDDDLKITWEVQHAIR